MMPVRRNQNWLPSIFNDFFDNDWMVKANATAPAINVFETAKEYKVELAAPGMTKEDFNVHIDEENNLVISMEKKTESKSEKQLLGSNTFTHILSYTSAACDARMAGAMIPVMSNSGSGNQGITATLPVVVYAEDNHKSESATNFNNRSIAWLLKNYNRIYDDPDMSLDLYTRQCSMGITADQLSVCAATIANDGLNPDTKKQVFDKELAPKITSLIATVGFYQHTGDWLYTSGVPAKTGVGGGVLGVMPGIMGIAAFAPPLDEAGNSVKAQLAIKYIMNKLGMNIFNGHRISIS